MTGRRATARARCEESRECLAHGGDGGAAVVRARDRPHPFRMKCRDVARANIGCDRRLTRADIDKDSLGARCNRLHAHHA